MSSIVKLKEPPAPVAYKGKDRLIGGWSTAGVGAWLLDKKLNVDRKYIHVSEIAVTAYGRDSQTNRAKVRRRVTPLRRWLADRNEFLLTEHGIQRTIIGLKVCDPSNENDRQVAQEQLARLEARGEITAAEIERWEQMLYLGGPSK